MGHVGDDWDDEEDFFNYLDLIVTIKKIINKIKS